MYYGKINAGVVQDKQPPRRLTAGSPEPQTAAPPAVDRHEYKKWMICFREQPTAEEDFYTRRLQDKLRISSLSFASDQPLRNPKPALKDFSSEQIPNPKMKTRAEWEGAVVAPHLYIRLFGLIAQHFLKHDMFENKSFKSYLGIQSHCIPILYREIV